MLNANKRFDNSITIQEGGRADKLLSKLLQKSRNQIEKLIKDGLVQVNGITILKPSFKFSIGDIVEYQFIEVPKREALETHIKIEILYEDDQLLVVNKPSGLVVHPAPSVKEPTLVDWLIQRGVSLSTISGEERHGIVHRIDKETTGALVIAKTNEAHQVLSAQLQDKSMGRYYLALIDYPLKENTIVTRPIARNSNNRLKMDIVNGGRDAKSSFVKLAIGENNIELIAAKLYTGRTHQIRVHLASLGRHILGDVLYGYRGHDAVKRVNLHAYLLYFNHPITKKRVTVEAPIFEDMREVIADKFDLDLITEMLQPTQIEKYFD